MPNISGHPAAVLAAHAVLATSLELILAETKFSSLKTDVMMIANKLIYDAQAIYN